MISRGKLRYKFFISLFWISIFLLALYSPVFFKYFLPKDNVLNIYSFTAIIPKEVIEKFTKETGILVRLTYFQSNEELFAKFNISGGQGYDLIIVSDYMIEILKKHNLLSDIDSSLIPNIEKIDPRLKNKYYDPKNKFSLPLVWTIYGLGIDKHFFEDYNGPHSWSLVFTNPIQHLNKFSTDKNSLRSYKVTMPDDPKEAIAYAALFLYGRSDNLNNEELIEIEKLLRKQKQWVESYTNEKIEEMLATDIVPLVIIPAAYMMRAMNMDEQYDFWIPKEGSVFVIENVAIPSKSQNVRSAHKFINFLLQDESMATISKKYFYNPANTKALQNITDEKLDFIKKFLDDNIFSSMRLIRNDIDLKKIDRIWLSVKSV